MISLKLEKSAKEAKVSQDLGAESSASMLSNQLFSLVGNINVDAGCSVSIFNRLYLLGEDSSLAHECGHRLLALRLAAATRGATASQRVIVINIAMG